MKVIKNSETEVSEALTKLTVMSSLAIISVF